MHPRATTGGLSRPPAAANALNGSLWGTMLAVGAGIGGLVSAAFGADVAFLVDAGSFILSAALLASIRCRFAGASPCSFVETDRRTVVEREERDVLFSREPPAASL